MSNEKEFIGKVFEKTFNNGGSVIKLTLSQQEKHLLSGRPGETTIEVKKSQKGKWYAEISQYQAPAQQQAQPPLNQQRDTFTDDDSNLPF